MDTKPSGKLKFLFWIILGAFSVFFAEVVSGADMLPYFHIWGLLVVFPLYTLHILVLSYIVFNYGKPWFYTLFIAGAIFGMYEAYMTKVLWNPSWQPFFSLAGIAVVEVFVIALFWHSFMSFIIPLFVSESILTNSREILTGLPNRIKQLFNSEKKGYILFASLTLLFGIFQSYNSFSSAHSLLSGFSTTAVLILLTYIWRNKTKGKEYDIRTLLPNKKEFSALLTLLIIMYIVLGIHLRPEALPGLAPQAIIWLIYLGLFSLLFFHLRKSKKMVLQENINSPIKFSWKVFIVLCLLFTVSSAVGKFVMAPVRDGVMMTFWLIFGVIGISVLFLSIKRLFQ